MGCRLSTLMPRAGKFVLRKLKEPEAPDHGMLGLPDKILIQIAEGLSPRDLFSLMFTARHLRRVLIPLILRNYSIVWSENLEDYVNSAEVPDTRRLKSLQLTDDKQMSRLDTGRGLREIELIIRSCHHLEELYVRSSDPFVDCWCFSPNALQVHGSTLKRFIFDVYYECVCYHTWIDWNEWFLPLFWSLGAVGAHNLECFGISILPWDMCRFFHAFEPPQSIRLLHLRARADPDNICNMAQQLRDAGLPKEYFPPVMQPQLDAPRVPLQANSDSCPKRMMDMEMFLQFATMVFGERGFPRLQILALGDISDRMHGWNNIMLCRYPAPRHVYPSFDFRVMHREDMYLLNTIEKSEDFMGMCRLDCTDDESLALVGITKYDPHYDPNNRGGAGEVGTQQDVEVTLNDQGDAEVGVAHHSGSRQEAGDALNDQGNTEENRATGNERQGDGTDYQADYEMNSTHGNNHQQVELGEGNVETMMDSD